MIKINEYAEVTANGGLAKVVNDTLKRSNAQNFIKNLANATWDYCHDESGVEPHPDQKRSHEVDDFWFSLRRAIDSAQNGYF